MLYLIWMISLAGLTREESEKLILKIREYCLSEASISVLNDVIKSHVLQLGTTKCTTTSVIVGLSRCYLTFSVCECGGWGWICFLFFCFVVTQWCKRPTHSRLV